MCFTLHHGAWKGPATASAFTLVTQTKKELDLSKAGVTAFSLLLAVYKELLTVIKQASSTLGNSSLLLMKPETRYKTQTIGRIIQQMDVMVQELPTAQVLNKYLHPA